MKIVVVILLLFYIQSSYLFAQKEFNGKEANKIIPGSEIVYFSKQNQSFPTYIKFVNLLDKEILLNKLQEQYEIKLKFISKEEDQLGIVHYKYQQFIDTIPVEWAISSFHTKNNKIFCL